MGLKPPLCWLETPELQSGALKLLCHEWDFNPHSAEQKHLSVSPAHLHLIRHKTKGTWNPCCLETPQFGAGALKPLDQDTPGKHYLLTNFFAGERQRYLVDVLQYNKCCHPHISRLDRVVVYLLKKDKWEKFILVYLKKQEHFIKAWPTCTHGVGCNRLFRLFFFRNLFSKANKIGIGLK